MLTILMLGDNIKENRFYFMCKILFANFYLVFPNFCLSSGYNVVFCLNLHFWVPHLEMLIQEVWDRAPKFEFYKLSRGSRRRYFLGQLENSWWKVMQEVITNPVFGEIILGCFF